MKYKYTKYQSTMYINTKYPIISGDGDSPTPPVVVDAHGDTSSLGYLGRFGVADRES